MAPLRSPVRKFIRGIQIPHGARPPALAHIVRIAQGDLRRLCATLCPWAMKAAGAAPLGPVEQLILPACPPRVCEAGRARSLAPLLAPPKGQIGRGLARLSWAAREASASLAARQPVSQPAGTIKATARPVPPQA